MKYRLIYSKDFLKKVEKLTIKDKKLSTQILQSLELLSLNPKNRALRSHKVSTRHLGEKWSSRVTGDIRIIWDYSQNDKIVIFVFTIGGHSGKDKVYK